MADAQEHGVNTLQSELKELSEAIEMRSSASAFKDAMEQLRAVSGDPWSEEHVATLSQVFAPFKPATISDQDEGTIRQALIDMDVPRELGKFQAALAVKFAELLHHKTSSDEDALMLLRATHAQRAAELKAVAGGPVPVGGTELDIRRAHVLQLLLAARDIPDDVAPLCSTVEDNLNNQAMQSSCVDHDREGRTSGRADTGQTVQARTFL